MRRSARLGWAEDRFATRHVGEWHGPGYRTGRGAGRIEVAALAEVVEVRVGRGGVWCG